MPARTKGRSAFDFHGRAFVWWVEGDLWLRIVSMDKRFVVAYPLLGLAGNQPPTLIVHGQEFPGLEPTEPRPVYLVTTRPTGRSMGAWVDQLLTWCFDTSHDLIKAKGPPRFV